jgi:hypothetical protein
MRVFTFELTSHALGELSQAPFPRGEREHFQVSVVSPMSTGEETMQLKTIVLATAFALTSSFAFAQAGGNAAGAEVPERSGPAVDGSNRAIGIAPHGTMNRELGTTTGMDRGTASGPSAHPGGPDRSKPGGEGTARNPSGD